MAGRVQGFSRERAPLIRRALQAAEEPSGAQKARDAANLEALLRHERERGDEAERQLASAQEEIRHLHAFMDVEAKDKETSRRPGSPNWKRPCRRLR